MKTFSHAYRKDILRPLRITVRKEVVVTGENLQRRESRLIADKEMGIASGFRFIGSN